MYLRPAATVILIASSVVVGAVRAETSSNALVEAVQADDRASVAQVLATHPNVNIVQDDGSTALAWAAIRSNGFAGRDLIRLQRSGRRCSAVICCDRSCAQPRAGTPGTWALCRLTCHPRAVNMAAKAGS